MSYQRFPAPLPSPPAEGHSLPFLPSKRIELIRRAGAFATPPPTRQGSWVFSADSDGDSECSDDSTGGRRMSLEERVMSIPTIVLTPPQSPVSQFLLSEEDIQSSLNANQRRERLFEFGSRLTGLGEKMGMINLSSFANGTHVAPESPSPVARARSVSPPPVSVAAPRRIQQQTRCASSFHNGSPTKDARRASADSFRPVDYNARRGDSISEIICPSPIKINIIPPQPTASPSGYTNDACSVESPSVTATECRQAEVVRSGHAESRRIVGGRFGTMSARQSETSWMPSQPAVASLNSARTSAVTQGSRRKSRPTPLSHPIAASSTNVTITFAESSAETKSTHFRAFPEPATQWTRFQGSRTRFKPYLFLLIPLALVFLHIYYLTVDRQFMRAGHALVFGNPIKTNDLWNSRDAILLDEDFDSLFDVRGAQIDVDAGITGQAEWSDADNDVGHQGERAQNSHSDLDGQKHRGGHGRWPRRWA